MPKKKTKFYAVAKGKIPGIYETWDKCKEQTDGFKGAIFKGFTSKDEAEKFVKEKAPPKEKRPNEAAIVDPEKEPVAKKRRKIEYDKSLDMTLNFDGGSRGNGKRRSPVAGAGAFLRITSRSKTGNGAFVQDEREEYRIRQFCQNADKTMSNNYAEYTGLIVGLKRAKRYLDDFGSLRNCKIRLTVLGDSQLVIKQTLGEYECRAENIKPLHKEATELVACIRRLACDDDEEEVVILEHVYRKDNADADELANEAMDERRSWTTHSTVSGQGTLFAKTIDLYAEEDNE